VGHLGDLRHLGHRHQPDEDHPDDRRRHGCVKVRMGCCHPDEPLGEECPCPVKRQKDCCQGVGCLELHSVQLVPPKLQVLLESRLLVQPVPLVLVQQACARPALEPLAHLQVLLESRRQAQLPLP
jgi:hypothetical protein